MDFVYSSEPSYSEYFSRAYPEATHVIVDAKRIKAFFSKNPGEVTVIPLPDRTLGSMTMPQTRIIIAGENADELIHELILSHVKL